MKTYDQSATLGFLQNQLTHVEPVVYREALPGITYPQVVPVDVSANEAVTSITVYSVSQAGEAQWSSQDATDVPRADVYRDKFETTVHDASIGYGYTMIELQQAQLLPNFDLNTERALTARRAAEQLLQTAAFSGDTARGLVGLINQPTAADNDNSVRTSNATARWTLAGTASSVILADVNTMLSGIFSGSLGVELADTLLLPLEVYSALAAKPVSAGSDTTVIEYIQRANVFTASTGIPLRIRALTELGNAASGNTGRAIAYRNSMEILKFHLPMPFRFMPAYQSGPFSFSVPGYLRTGGLEVRRPKSIYYMDNVSA